MSLGQLKTQAQAQEIEEGKIADKWQVYRWLCEGKEIIGVGDRSLAVLNALLSFLPDNELAEENGLQRPILLGLVIKACPEIADYAVSGIGSWRELLMTAAQVRGYLGISPSAYEEALGCSRAGKHSNCHRLHAAARRNHQFGRRISAGTHRKGEGRGVLRRANADGCTSFDGVAFADGAEMTWFRTKCAQYRTMPLSCYRKVWVIQSYGIWSFFVHSLTASAAVAR